MAGAIGKLADGLRPPPRLVRGEILTCGGFAATPRLLPQKEGDHSRSEWWKIYLSAVATNAPTAGFTLSQPNG